MIVRNLFMKVELLWKQHKKFMKIMKCDKKFKKYLYWVSTSSFLIKKSVPNPSSVSGCGLTEQFVSKSFINGMLTCYLGTSNGF